MGGYVANFMVYTMAMIGLICFAVFVYKKIMDGSLGKRRTNYIEIEDTLNLNPRKTLHVVRAGNEKFLIASDIDRTTLISRLNGNITYLPEMDEYQDSRQSFRNAMDYVAQKQMEVNNGIKPQVQSEVPKRVHLEPITRKSEHGIGISNIRKSMDMRASAPTAAASAYQAKQQKQVPLQQPQRPQQPQRQVQSQQARPAVAQKSPKVVATGNTMKDMAKKINQL